MFVCVHMFVHVEAWSLPQMLSLCNSPLVTEAMASDLLL